MHFKSIVRELKEVKDGIGNISRRSRTRSHIAPDQVSLSVCDFQQGRWANLPPELLLDIIRRVEESETAWPARAAVVFCGSVCKSWRQITKEIVKTPEECGRLTFPASLKQPGPHESPIQCFIRRDRANKTFFLYYGLVPSEDESDKLLLAAKKVRRAASTDFVISLAFDDFSRASSTYIGKLRSNFLGTKFTIYDSNPPCEATGLSNCKTNRRFSTNRVSPKVSAYHYSVGTINYELNVLRTRGPRRMCSVMHSIPISSLEGGSVSIQTSNPHSSDEQASSVTSSKGKESIIDVSSTSLGDQELSGQGLAEPLILKNKAPRWHEQLQCWCLNFKGRVTVASVKNFQLAAAVEPHHDISSAEQDKVILQFGKIGKDIFTMDYCYPLSAFQAFAICLSSFDTKPACE